LEEGQNLRGRELEELKWFVKKEGLTYDEEREEHFEIREERVRGRENTKHESGKQISMSRFVDKKHKRHLDRSNRLGRILKH
jgi:hypothetical protein